MSSKTKAKGKLRPVKRKVLRVENIKEPSVRLATESEKLNPRLIAQSTLRPSVQAASTIRAWNPGQGDLDILELVHELFDQSRAVIAGNMGRPEAILIDQAHTLDAIFNNLARRAATNIDGHVIAADVFLKLALRAQSQCRATLETLATLKNPPSIAFVRQANVANGPQQVNNYPASHAHAGRNDCSPNKLLEQQPNEWVDARTAPTAIETDKTMEAMAQIDRSAISHGKVDRE